MTIGENLTTVWDRIRRDGPRATFRRVLAVVIERVRPPSEMIFWIRPADVTQIDTPTGARLRVVHSIDELTQSEQREIVRSNGTSSVEVWRRRFAAGLEAHLLFLGDRLAASRFVIWGAACPFHHVVLTAKDTMSMDLRVHPDFRGKGLATAFFSQSIQHLASSGCERIYVTVLVNNETVNRMVSRLGFVPLVRWHHVRGGYAYEKEIIQ